MAMQRISGKRKRTLFRSDPVASAGQSVSGISIDGPEINIVNPAPTQNSSGQVVPAGSSIISVGPNSATINASYIKTGVLDANLMRTGQIQTIASWNSRSYGSDFDAIEAQQGFTGGYVYLQDWSTVSENTVYAEFASWGTYESGTTTATVGASAMFEVGDYVRVTGAYFGDPNELTRPTGQNANVGIIDQHDGPLGYAEIVAVDTVGTGVTYTVTNTSKSTLESGLVAKSQQYIPTMSKANQVLSIDAQRISGPNPAGIYSVFVTTVTDHDFVIGDYVELASCGPVYSGVWYVVSVPSTREFYFRHRFNLDFGAVISSESLPSIDAPVAIRVRKAYSVTSNGDLTSASLNIRTAKTQDGGEPVFQVLNDSIVIRKSDGTVLLGVTAGGSFIDIGTVTADEITVGGDINANQVVRVGNYPDATSPTFQGIWAGNATPASAEFSVDLDGNLVATNATITGAVTATSGSFTGTVTAASGRIGGFTIGATALTATNIVADSSGYVSVGSGNNVAVMSGADANYRFWAGDSNAATANFVVDKAGNITARSFSLTGIGSISAIDAITVSDVLGSGVVTNAKIATVSADKIQTNTLTLSGLSAAAITSTNFIVSNTGSVTASDVTLSNSNVAAVGASQVGSINLKPNAVGTTNVGGSLLTVWSDHDAASMAASTYSSWTISDITGDGPSSTVGATITVTIESGHDIGVGQYVSFHGVSGTNWTSTDSQSEAVRVKTVSATTFTFTAPYAMGTATLSSATVRGYKTLTLVAPGGVFIADAIAATLSPGMIGVGSIALGSNFENIGGDPAVTGGGTPKPKDGEIVFTTPLTSPAYTGGANLFSRSGKDDIATSGDFEIGVSDTSALGAIIFKGGNGGSIRAFSATAGNDSIAIKNTDGSAYTALVADTFFPGGQGSFRLDHDGNFDLNDSLDVTGAITATSSVSAAAFTASTSGTALNASGGGDIYLYGPDVTVPVTGNGELTAIPNTTTLTTNSARWVLLGDGEYALRRDSSTRRAKTNIVEADDAVLAAAKNLRAVHYEALEKDAEGNVVPSGKHTLGLIAEEIAEAGLGCAVTYDGEGLPDGYDERVIIAALLHRINDLEARLAELEGRE
jgi:hypothetical protein